MRASHVVKRSSKRRALVPNHIQYQSIPRRFSRAQINPLVIEVIIIILTVHNESGIEAYLNGKADLSYTIPKMSCKDLDVGICPRITVYF